MKRHATAPEERAARLRAAQETMRAGLDRLRESDAFEAYLRCCARFHRYSSGNILMILAQRPDASRVAGYRQWQALGRQVRAGEKGISILRPCTTRRTDEETGETVTGLAGFGLTHVWDVSQTDGAALPALAVRLEGQEAAAEAALSQATAAALALGFSLGFAAAPEDGSNGSYEPARRAIHVNTAGRSLAQQAKTLVHELAHGLTVDRLDAMSAEDRRLAELIAEGTAYVVCDFLGLETGAYSFGYLATYGATAAQMELVAGVIHDAAHRLIEAIESANGVAAA